jgi:hypothetical protein
MWGRQNRPTSASTGIRIAGAKLCNIYCTTLKYLTLSESIYMHTHYIISFINQPQSEVKKVSSPLPEHCTMKMFLGHGDKAPHILHLSNR